MKNPDAHRFFSDQPGRSARTTLVFCVVILLSSTLLKAQEINFGKFSSKYSVSITELIPADDLAFGW